MTSPKQPVLQWGEVDSAVAVRAQFQQGQLKRLKEEIEWLYYKPNTLYFPQL